MGSAVAPFLRLTNIKGRVNYSAFKDAIIEASYFLKNLLLNPASPARPEARRSMVAGSGTGAETSPERMAQAHRVSRSVRSELAKATVPISSQYALAYDRLVSLTAIQYSNHDKEINGSGLSVISNRYTRTYARGNMK